MCSFDAMRFAVAAFTMLAALSPAACMAQSQDLSGEIVVGAQTRMYLLHLPPSSGQGVSPLVINLHGGGGLASGAARITHFDQIADRNHFVVVYPQGVNRHWADGRTGGPPSASDDVQFISALISKLGREDHIDPRRIYATGLSNGAIFSERLGCELSARIAAIAPVAGPLPVDIVNACRPATPPAVLLIHGTADPLVPYGGGRTAGGGDVASVQDTLTRWAALNRCAGPAQRSSMSENDGMPVDLSTFSRCANRREVELIEVENGGHTWPGGEQYLPPFIIGRTSQAFDASETIWEFFRRFTL